MQFANGRTSSAPPSAAQRFRLAAFGVKECVDVHCHCLPGVDDGPPDLAASLKLCRALVEDGVTTVVATPHQLGRYDGQNSAEQVRQACAMLRAALATEGIPLQVAAGGDVRVDERVLDLLDADQISWIADGGKYLLIELPHQTLVDLRRLTSELSARGGCLVLTHPERHEVLNRQPELIVPWLRLGAIVQLTAGSLVGDFGPEAERAAWHWLERGQAHVVASDAHDTRRRPPRMTDAIEAIGKRLGFGVVRKVCIDHPARILAGQPIVVPTRNPSLAAGRQR